VESGSRDQLKAWDPVTQQTRWTSLVDFLRRLIPLSQLCRSCPVALDGKTPPPDIMQ